MLRSALIASVRGQIDDDTFSAALITEASNWFVDEVCNNNHLRRMEDSESLNADTEDTTMDFPDEMKTMISLYLTVPQVYDMGKSYMSYGDFMQSHANFATATAARAQQWTDFGNAVRFAAPIDATHEFQLDYLRKPIPVVDDNDEYDFADNYNELLVMGTLVRVLERDEDYVVAGQKRDIMEPLMTAFVKNESRGQIKTGGNVIRTGRGRRTYSAKDF